MDLNIDYDNEFLYVAVTGRLDLDTQAEFKNTTLKNLQDTGARGVIIDLAKTEYISSAGLQGLLIIASQCARQGVASAVCSLQSEVAKVYRTGGFERVLNYYDTREGAADALAGG